MLESAAYFFLKGFVYCLVATLIYVSLQVIFRKCKAKDMPDSVCFTTGIGIVSTSGFLSLFIALIALHGVFG